MGHPSWECYHTNSLNFRVHTKPEASELPKDLILGRDGNIHIRLTRSTPLGAVGSYNPGQTWPFFFSDGDAIHGVGSGFRPGAFAPWLGSRVGSALAAQAACLACWTRSFEARRLRLAQWEGFLAKP